MWAPRLLDHAGDQYSQFGDDGMIRFAIEQIGEQSRFCVEFGAGDGYECSNTAALRERGWEALLMESDPALFEECVANAPEADVRRVHVTGQVVDAMVAGRPVDVMSIDVDGDDWFIFATMQTRPRLVVIEFNCSIPPGVFLRAKEPGGRFGASISSIVKLAVEKGYELIGLNHTNAFFVPAEELGPFKDYERRVPVLMEGRDYSLVVTDYDGRPRLVRDDSFFWGFTGFADPCTEELVE